MSWVVASAIATHVLAVNGPLNDALAASGLAGHRISFLTRPDLFRPLLVVTDLWKNSGTYSLMFFASMTAIDASYYHAAAIDGAGPLAQIRHVSLPIIAPMVVTVAALVLITTIDTSFEQIVNLYNPAVYETGDILGTYVYRTGLIFGKFSEATAAGIVKSVVNLAVLGCFFGAVALARRHRAS